MVRVHHRGGVARLDPAEGARARSPVELEDVRAGGVVERDDAATEAKDQGAGVKRAKKPVIDDQDREPARVADILLKMSPQNWVTLIATVSVTEIIALAKAFEAQTRSSG